MSLYLWLAFFILLIPWFISRIIASIVCWAFDRYLKIDVRIQKVGYFNFRNITIHFPNSMVVQLDCLWFSSSFVDNNIGKPIAACISDIRIELNDSGGGQPVVDEREQLQTSGTVTPAVPTKLARLLPWIQMTSVHVQNVNVMLLKSVAEECLIHCKVQDFRWECSVEGDSLELNIDTSAVVGKIIRDVQEEGIVHQQLADLSTGCKVSLLVNMLKLEPQLFKLSLSKPHILVTEGLVHKIQTARHRDRQTAQAHGEQQSETCHNDRTGLSFLKFIPRVLDLTVDGTSMVFSRETAQRDLSMDCGLISATVKHSQHDGLLSTGDLSLKIENFHSSSPQSKLASFQNIHINVKMTEKSVDLYSKLISPYLCYYHEEVQYWHTAITRLKVNTEPHDLKQVQSPKRSTIHSLVGTRNISLSAILSDLSATFATATYAGFDAGLTHTKLTVQHYPSLQETHGAIILEGVHCCLANDKRNNITLTACSHYWDTLLYLGRLEADVIKNGNRYHVESTVDGLQLEWSTGIAAGILQLLTAFHKTNHRADVVPRDMNTSDQVVQPCPSPDISLKPVHAEGGGRVDGESRVSRSDVNVFVKCQNVNVFLCCGYRVGVMLRIDSAGLQSKQGKHSLDSQGVKCVYLATLSKREVLMQSSELNNYVGHLKELRIVYRDRTREVTCHLLEEVFCVWDTSFHMCLLESARDACSLKPKIDVLSSQMTPSPAQPSAASLLPLSAIQVLVQANLFISLQMSNQHRVCFSTPELSVRLTLTDISISAEAHHLSVTFDQHDIIQMQGVHITSLHHADTIKYERQGFKLDQMTNRAWAISFEDFKVVFPYQYNFAACFEEVINTTKWIKHVHKIKKKPFTILSPLPPDLIIRSKCVTVQFSDDPFEVKLGDNYDLLIDESKESRKRLAAMDKKVNELRGKHQFLPASKLEELYGSLMKRNSEIYLQRSRQLYSNSPMRNHLFTWKWEDLEVMALADVSLHGKENATKHMRDIDSESPYPEELEFTTLWCRMVNVSVKHWTIQLRDYPQNMLDISDLHVWGRLIGAEQEGAKRAKRSCPIEVGDPWGNMTVERSMPALKFYHDFSSDVGNFNMMYGACWEQTMAQFNLAMDLVNKPSLDPSRPMPFWDKIRNLLHGRLTMSIEHMSWLYHASLDPYNTSEVMDWSWTDLVLDWTNAKFVLKGNLDIYARTASKYDDCCLLHLPNLRFVARLQWLCRADPNDHHSVMPCAPDKIPEFSLEEHDSYRAFRSKNLNLNISFETKPEENRPDETPSLLFYASTLRFLEKIKMCMITNVTRPTRRGPLFNNRKPQKPALTRHYKNVSFSVKLHKFQVTHWMSFAQQQGANLKGGPFEMETRFHLRLVPLEDGLIHRPRADWSIRKLSCELNEAKTWLISTEHNASESTVERRSYFMGLKKVVYERNESNDVQPVTVDDGMASQDKPNHKLQIYDLKAIWSVDNRDIAFGIYDGYKKANNIKRNLSAAALKGFKVDSSPTPQKPRSVSFNSPASASLSAAIATPSPLSRIQSGHAYSMLQKLIVDADNKFVAFTEEEPSAGSKSEQLSGMAACQTDDVLHKNWLIELHNSQAMLKGCESPGYVIVSAAKAQILSCIHQPVWKDRQLKSKTTWVSSVDTMQYYATVDKIPVTADEDIMWLSVDNIADRSVDDFSGVPEMVGSGQSVGGVVTNTVGATGSQDQDKPGIQLQRIISRCKCQLFYASYGDIDPASVVELPLLPSGVSDMMTREEGVDSFTLLHHDLNICSNSAQYLMIIDIVNNLLLYVEPKKKEASERQQRMWFALQLTSTDDQRTPILNLQNNVRGMVENLRKLERELWNLEKTDIVMRDNGWHEQCLDLRHRINECKEQMNGMNEELTMMINCFTQCQLQNVTQVKASKAQQTSIVRRNEVFFQYAQWRLTEPDGQLGIADVVLKNFLYSKINTSDDSGSHRLELGWVRMTNLLANSLYKDVLVPQERCDHQVALRIFSQVKPPVGGISVKEHFEVNVVPLTIQLTYHFFRSMMGFLFPGKNIEAEDQDNIDSHDGNSVAKSKKKSSVKRKSEQEQDPDDDDIDKMKKRAAENNMFLFIKIPEVPLRVSYKGEKDKNIGDLNDFFFLLPTLEYHSRTWTWMDLVMQIKTDLKRVLLSQAIKQKLHMKSKFYLNEEVPVSDAQQEEDKAKMLLGDKLLGGNERPSSKKSLFGKSSKS